MTTISKKASRQLLREMRQTVDELERDYALSDEFAAEERKALRKKTLAETTDAVMNAGLSWDQSEKTLVFYASRFTGNRPDKANDVIDPGAFDKWYRRWKSDPLAEYPNTRGKLPIVWSHSWQDVTAVVGWAEVDDVTIDTKGLLVAAHLFDTPEARRIWETARDMGLAASFSYDVAKGGEHRTSKGFNLITEFETIMECGPCLLGAEPSAGTHSVKAADAAIAEFDAVLGKMKTSEKAPRPTTGGKPTTPSRRAPLGVASMNPLRNALNAAGVERRTVARILQSIRTVFHGTGQIKPPSGALKGEFNKVPPEKREALMAEMRRRARARSGKSADSRGEPLIAAPPRCDECGTMSLERQPITAGAAWSFCTACATITLIESKSRPRSIKQREATVRAIMRKIEIVDTFASRPPKRRPARPVRPSKPTRRRKYMSPESLAEKSRRMADVADLTIGVIEGDLHRKAGVARDVARDIERRVAVDVELLANEIELARATAKADVAAERTKAVRLAAVAALERVPVTQDVRASAKAELAAIAKVVRDGKPRAQSRSSIEGAFGPAPALTAEQLTGI